jgi:hypothetical protein
VKTAVIVIEPCFTGSTLPRLSLIATSGEVLSIVYAVFPVAAALSWSAFSDGANL